MKDHLLLAVTSFSNSD